MDFSGMKVLIIGLARSGLAAISALNKRGCKITACDIRNRELLREAAELLEDMDVDLYFGSYPTVTKKNFDIVVVSPGVPLDIDPIQHALEGQIKIIGEVELAYLLKSPYVEMYAVTGTNGKTTTTSLLQRIFEINGDISVAGGNIGTPLIKIIDELSKGIISVEVSSFQLETIERFKPHICGLLNITPDHLDRHKTMQNYIDAKAKIFLNQDKNDFTILNYEDETVRDFSKLTKGQVIFFSNQRILHEGIYIENEFITVNYDGSYKQICHVDELKIRGKHNLENILCAVAMAVVAGVKPNAISEALQTFTSVRHRLEEVADYNDILYINDSKATNPESTIKAIESFTRPIILLAGGRPKGADFSHLAELISNKVKSLVLIGEAKESIKRAVIDIGFTNIYETEDFYSAVKTSKDLAMPGDVVLLSPACASWDMFKSYEQRGDMFCEIVHSILNQELPKSEGF